MLVTQNLSVSYGAITAVRGVDLTINAGEIVALIGANGAGKSTIARAVAGLVRFQGEIRFEGRHLRPNAAEKNLRAGIALVPEGRGVLAQMTVDDNLMMGLYCRRDRRAAFAELEHWRQRFPILAERRAQMAGMLSGGEQQILAIVRALLSKPRLLLLDEPSLGLAPKLTDFVVTLVGELRDQGLTVLLVEQKARQALKIADRAYLMETGRIVKSGAAHDLIDDPVVSETFLGVRTNRRELLTE
jgi:branched-chain amino acid transport system ATP-binding protein